MAKKTRKKRSAAKTAPRARKTDDSLSGIGTAELAAELRRRERSVVSLQRKRDRLLEQLAEVDAQITEAGAMITRAGGVPVGRKRHRNDASLEQALYDLLNGQVMSVTDATHAVQSAGYRTTSPNFRTIVNQTLLKSNRFKKVARGQYTAK